MPVRHSAYAAAATGTAETSASVPMRGAVVSSTGPSMPPTLLDAAATPLPVARSVVG